MTNVLNRRSFLAGALGTPWLASQLMVATDAAACEPPPTLDIHVHLFGVGDGGTGCRIAKSITEG